MYTTTIVFRSDHVVTATTQNVHIDKEAVNVVTSFEGMGLKLRKTVLCRYLSQNFSQILSESCQGTRFSFHDVDCF